jgi:RES domain-containing protein
VWPSTGKRNSYTIEVALGSVIDLTGERDLMNLGLSDTDLAGDDHAACQLFSGAVEWLGHDGLLVPSARATGTNLVIFPNKQQAGYQFNIVDRKIL